MVGQGGPQRGSEAGRYTHGFLALLKRAARTIRWPFAPRCAVLLVAALFSSSLLAQDQMQTRIRVVWGGGATKRWQGSLRITGGSLSNLQDLGLSADSPGSKDLTPQLIQVSSVSPLSFDGFDISLSGPANAAVTLEFSDASPPVQRTSPVRVELSLEELASMTASEDWELDDANNRLIIRRVPGDELRVAFTRDTLVFTPSEEFSFEIEPNIGSLEPNASLRLRMQLFAAQTATELWNTQETLTAKQTGILEPAPPTTINVPEDEGVYDLVITLHRRGVPGIRRGSLIAERRIQFVVIDPVASDSPPGEWQEGETIDPTSPGWRAWAAKIPGMSLIPGLETKPLTNAHPPKPVQIGEEVMLQLAPGQWQAYPIPITAEGQPHLLEVELPSNMPQTLGISIVEPNAAGEVVPMGLDSGVHIPEHMIDEQQKIARHRLVFWPRTKAPLILLVNHRADAPALFGRIHVYSGPDRLPEAPIVAAPSERLLTACFDRPLFCENFSAGGELDPLHQQVLDDWSKFYLGTTRLAQYLKYAGYNAAVICVARDGSGLYPSGVLLPTPRYDSGIFFTTGQDPIRKDVLEMMLRIFDREGLQLIPAIHFSGHNERLEQAVRSGVPASQGIRLEHLSGNASETLYNPLHPQVQEFMRATVRELTQRYSRHPSFHGVAIQLSAGSYSIFPDERWAVDAQTLNRFRRTAFDGTEPEQLRQFENAAAMLRNSESRQRWLQWRAQELSRLYSGIYESIKVQRPDARLWLLTGEMFQGRSQQAMLQPALPAPEKHPVIIASLSTGIDAPLYRREPGIVLFRPHRHSASNILNEQAVNIHLNAPEVDSYFRGSDAVRGELSSGAQFFCEPLILPLPSFDERSPFGKDVTHAVIHTHATQPGMHSRQRWAHALATLDTHDVVDGGWMMPLGQEENLLPLIETYRSLPRQPFQKVAPKSKGATQPVVVRALSYQGRTWFYLVNDSPWPVRCEVEYTSRMDGRLQTLGSRSWPAPFRRMDRWSWTIDLEPYDLVGAWVADPQATVLDWQVQLSPEVPNQLAQQIARLRGFAVAAAKPIPLAAPTNLNFEATPAAAEIPGWEHKSGPGLSVKLDAKDKNSGSFALHMSSNHDELWLRSESFPPPKTGRLYALMRLKTRNVAEQPVFRVVLDVKDRFYEARTVGRGSGATPLPDEWGEGSDFLFAFEQLPIRSLDKLHLGFDLMGKGDVWIDDIQLFEMWFTTDEQNALIYASTVAENELKHSLNVRSAQLFLESFWPRFMLTYGDVASTPDERAAAREMPADEAKPKRTTMDQMRDLVPKVPFKVPFTR